MKATGRRKVVIAHYLKFHVAPSAMGSLTRTDLLWCKAMGKRRSDADSRRFFDEFAKVRVSRFRADGTIDPTKNQAIIPFPNGTNKLIGVKHTWFAKGGGWSYFVCPRCGRRAANLWLVEDAPRCVKCCDAMNIKHASMYGFGREERRRAADKRLDQLIAKLEATEPLRLKPTPKSWGGKAQIVYGGHRLAETMRTPHDQPQAQSARKPTGKLKSRHQRRADHLEAVT